MRKKPDAKKKGTPIKRSARHLAITILFKCCTSSHTLDYWLEKWSAQIDGLQRADRALLHALVYGVLRWQSRLDWIIDQLAKRPAKKMDALVRIVLRVGLFQLVYLDRIPPSAAVNTAVEWVKKNHRSWASGFVNSVLRRAADQTHQMVWPDIKKDPAKAIAIQHAFPHWLISRWITRRGVAETRLLCQTINTIPPLTLRTNTLKTTRDKLMAAITDMADVIEPTQFSPEGVCFVSPVIPISKWPLFRQGDFQIQDEAAQIIAHLLLPQPGQRIWDACAGLGTKTAHIAQLMENRGHILASDAHRGKLDLLEAEMQRLSITIVNTRCMDFGSVTPNLSHFDRILVDAPCSGLGVLQKNPDGKWRTQPNDLIKNGRRQLMFLEQALPYLAPGGRLVYAVCSTEPEENEVVIDHFLQKHPEFVIHTPEIDTVPHLEKLLTADGYLKTLPHHHQMDGFFAAVLKKQTESSTEL